MSRVRRIAPASADESGGGRKGWRRRPEEEEGNLGLGARGIAA